MKTTSHMQSSLGQFLKSRRERLQPSMAGISPLPGRRRTPGLRIQEVAYLANVSVTYYTWLEQGRETKPSQEVLTSIGKALQLSADEFQHLFELANGDILRADKSQSEKDIDCFVLQKLVEQFQYPSFISNEETGVITAWNRSAELVIADFGSIPEEERNLIQLIFLNPDYRRRLENWESLARYSTAFMRANFDRYKDNPVFMERFKQLLRDSEDFARFWDLFEIQQKRVTRAAYFLPDGQRMDFEIHSATGIDNDPNLHWCIFMPVASTNTEEQLIRLLEKDKG
ncbi:helix-turn-helix transcriptional regulator [Paenibacillus glycanilyticus]|uniref:helix-turn-helix transcriptional regulator n=1 Tax=Paenibacillus glycanilyticus TaxID=126569 RepID=UPI001FD25C92|nr:helix-turn-helix transcriptional regulator [Paenibacillus glycanilyticus]